MPEFVCMENLSQTSKPSKSKENSTSEAVSSIYNFDDLSATEIFSDHFKTTRSFVLFIVVVAAAASAFFLITGCLNICKSSNESAALMSTVVSRDLDSTSINVASLYSSLISSPDGVGGLRKLQDYENTYITFIKVRLLTNYLTGEQPFISLSYKKNRVDHTLNVPIKPAATFLYYDGSLSAKPYFTNFNGLQRTILPGQNFYIGLLSGKMTDEERSYCDTNKSLCTILDMYNKDRVAIDALLATDTLVESTQTIELPIYFVGVTK